MFLLLPGGAGRDEGGRPTSKPNPFGMVLRPRVWQPCGGQNFNKSRFYWPFRSFCLRPQSFCHRQINFCQSQSCFGFDQSCKDAGNTCFGQGKSSFCLDLINFCSGFGRFGDGQSLHDAGKSCSGDDQSGFDAGKTGRAAGPGDAKVDLIRQSSGKSRRMIDQIFH